ncbi:MAG: ATP-grasp domain-containing protein [Hydrotalea sp.]|nr:ATP-grasp domain-containing protein [Hydrotalea sp.]
MIKVLITSAGTASAISVIKALKRQKEIDVFLFATDMNKLAPGLFFADEYFISPPITSSEYVNTIIEFCCKNQITVLIPIFSKEIRVIAESKDLFDKHNIRTLIPSYKSILNCDDKNLMYRKANNLQIKYPKIFLKSELEEYDFKNSPALFVKPVSGSSSKGSKKIDNIYDLSFVLTSTEDLIIQEFIDAEEVTVDVFCPTVGIPKVISPRIRIETKNGQSIKAMTLKKEPFIDLVYSICNEFSILGVSNIQFFKTDHDLIFIEINPRFAAGGLMLTIESGANIPLLVLKKILGMNISENEYQSKEDIIMLRYWEEIFIHA